MSSLGTGLDGRSTTRNPDIGRQVAEKSFAVLGLLFFAGAVWPLLAGDDSAGSLLLPAKTVPELRLVTYPTYAAVVGLSVFYAPRIIPLLRNNLIIIVLIALACLSSLWSVDPALSLRRSAVLAVTTLFAFYLVSRFSTAEIMKLIVVSFGIAAVLSLLILLVRPDLALMADPRGDLLRGVFVHKNIMSEFMLFGGAAALVLAVAGNRGRAVYLLLYLTAMLLVLLSNSATYLVIGLLLAPVAVIAAIRRRVSLLLFVTAETLLFAVALFLLTVVVSDPDWVLGLLGRERTLTGRTDVWQAVWELIQMRFWLGYGYGAFWDGAMAPGHDVRVLIGEYAHAHNGWLDLWLSIGTVGVALMAASFIGALARAARNIGIRRQPVAVLGPIAFLLAIILLSLVENGLAVQNTVTWVAYVVASASANLRQDPARLGSHRDLQTKCGRLIRWNRLQSLSRHHRLRTNDR